MIACLHCGKKFEPDRRVASMSGSIMGDECTDSFFLCEGCGMYTVESYYEPFLGEETSSCRGPLSREEGEAAVKLIKSCSEPWNKKCRCDAHRAYFRGQLD